MMLHPVVRIVVWSRARTFSIDFVLHTTTQASVPSGHDDPVPHITCTRRKEYRKRVSTDLEVEGGLPAAVSLVELIDWSRSYESDRV